MIRVTNIQRMCFDDGPGIRTTVFLKGCSIHCPWCSNPEFLLEGADGDISGCYGEDYNWDDLLKIIMKDYNFWGDDGGVTFSGGEALLQIEELEPLLSRLKKMGVSLGVETALFVSDNLLEIAIHYFDFYYIDVKILDTNKCHDILGGNINTFFKNVDKLSSVTDNITFRVPCSKEYVLEDENRRQLCEFLLKYKRFPVEIFSIHRLGEKKYQTLSLPLPKKDAVTEKDLIDFQKQLINCGVKTDIIHI